MRPMSYLDHEDDALAYEHKGEWQKAIHAWMTAKQATSSRWLHDRCDAMIEHCRKQLPAAHHVATS